jgi:hypothetical protein
VYLVRRDRPSEPADTLNHEREHRRLKKQLARDHVVVQTDLCCDDRDRGRRFDHVQDTGHAVAETERNPAAEHEPRQEENRRDPDVKPVEDHVERIRRERDQCRERQHSGHANPEPLRDHRTAVDAGDRERR